MFVPRTFIIAGIVLVAISLGASGHGLWWLVGLVWAFGWIRNGRHACHVGRGHHGRRHDERHHQNDHQLDHQHDRGAGGADPIPSQAPQPVSTPDPTHDRHEAFPAR